MEYRKFKPLPADHPSVGTECPVCEKQFQPGDVTTLIPNESQEQPPQRGWRTVETVLVHYDCTRKAVADGT